MRFPHFILLLLLVSGCSNPEYTRGASPVDSIARQFLHSVIQQDTQMMDRAVSGKAKLLAASDSLAAVVAYFNGSQPASVELVSNEVASDESTAGVEHHRLQYRITFADNRQISYFCQLTATSRDTTISDFRFRWQ
ncbi:MAG: hypothetical protein UZ07_CHB004002857 [Chlorobi bacterium OLB7]|nr:MAG: hypothetical protein UZ07_CHB004002857 [Chlorobi bacterium OLB7]